MYGFLQCTSNGDNLSFKFIDVDGTIYEERNSNEGLRLLSEQQGGRIKTKKNNKKKKKKNSRKTLRRRKVLKTRKRMKYNKKLRKTSK